MTDLVRWLYQDHGLSRTDTTIKRWLTNPIIRGHLAYNQGKDILYNTHQALITEAEYRAILRRLEDNRRIWGHNKGRFFAVPNSIVFCAKCGSQCHSCHNQRRRYFYCWKARKRGDCDAPRKYTRDDWIEAAIQNAITDRAELLATLATPDDAPDPRIIELQQQLEQLQPLSSRPVIAAEITAIQQEIAQIKTARGNQAASAVEFESMINDFSDATPEDWEQLGAEGRRAIYSELVQSVTVLGGEVVGVVLKA